jgi:hypothetical protein
MFVCLLVSFFEYRFLIFILPYLSWCQNRLYHLEDRNWIYCNNLNSYWNILFVFSTQSKDITFKSTNHTQKKRLPLALRKYVRERVECTGEGRTIRWKIPFLVNNNKSGYYICVDISLLRTALPLASSQI